MHLQSLELAWRDGNSPAATSVVVEYRLTGSSTWSAGGTATGQTFTVSPLAPESAYELRLTPVDGQGASGPSTEFGPFTTAFSGSRSDWLPGQAVTALSGEPFFLTWSATRLYVGASGPGGAPPLGTGDQLLVAISREGSPIGGSLTLSPVASLLVPFEVQLLARMEVLGPASTRLTLEDFGVGQQTLSTPQYAGLVDEFALDRSGLPEMTPAARVVMAVVRNNPVRVSDLAPVNPDAFDYAGELASVSSEFNIAAHLWDPAGAQRSAVDAPRSETHWPLARFSVRATTNVGAPRLRPIEFFQWLDPTVTEIPTFDDGTHGDVTANDGVFSVRLPACHPTLHFKFADNLGEEPALPIGSDRVWSCFGDDLDAPEATWNERWSATHPFTIDFGMTSGTRAIELRGNANELGNWGASPGPAMVDGNAGVEDPNLAHSWRITVPFAPRDMVASPLEWKGFYGPGANDYEGGSNHVLNDDVMGRWAMGWATGDSSTF